MGGDAERGKEVREEEVRSTKMYDVYAENLCDISDYYLL